MIVIEITHLRELPTGRLVMLGSLPAAGIVYRYTAPTMIGGRTWILLFREAQ